MVNLVQVAAIRHKLYEAAQAKATRLSAEVSELRDKNLRLRAERTRLTNAHAQVKTTLTNQTAIEADWEGDTVERQRSARALAARYRADSAERVRRQATINRDHRRPGRIGRFLVTALPVGCVLVIGGYAAFKIGSTLVLFAMLAIEREHGTGTTALAMWGLGAVVGVLAFLLLRFVVGVLWRTASE